MSTKNNYVISKGNILNLVSIINENVNKIFTDFDYEDDYCGYMHDRNMMLSALEQLNAEFAEVYKNEDEDQIENIFYFEYENFSVELNELADDYNQILVIDSNNNIVENLSNMQYLMKESSITLDEFKAYMIDKIEAHKLGKKVSVG